MQFADRSDLVPGLSQPVVPARHAAFVRDCVVPKADAMDIAPGRQCGARRHADRRVAIGVAEAHASGCEPVEVRRADHRMAGAAEHARIVLVSQDEEQVCGWVSYILVNRRPGHEGPPRHCRPDNQRAADTTLEENLGAARPSLASLRSPPSPAVPRGGEILRQASRSAPRVVGMDEQARVQLCDRRHSQ